jgi:hypothetical protein
MENHWFKASMTPEWEEGAKEYFDKVMNAAMMTDEVQCGVTNKSA